MPLWLGDAPVMDCAKVATLVRARRSRSIDRLIVAQIFNLLYRRIASCEASAQADHLGGRCSADYKPAIQQSPTLRYIASVAQHIFQDPSRPVRQDA